MSKRLQVILEDSEMMEIRELAEQKRLTVAEWVRRALRMARNQEPSSGPGEKIEAVRAAAKHLFPTADMDDMLAQIESGYLSSSDR